MDPIVLVGGRLANGLIAWRLADLLPDLPIVVLEKDATLGGQHTWCLHASDAEKAHQTWIRPLMTKIFPGHEVRFPRFARTIHGEYWCWRSRDFHQQMLQRLGRRLRLGSTAASLAPNQVVLASGERIAASLVIDGRGPEAGTEVGAVQKFFGLVLRTTKPHGYQIPLLMDATVSQQHGYRFVYIIPWSEHELLIEDTYYSANPALDTERLRLGLLDYATRAGLGAFSELETEQGILPIPLLGAPRSQAANGVLRSGLLAGLYHPTTGYSFAPALRFADWLAHQLQGSWTAQELARRSADYAARHWRRGRFLRRLNHMLICATPPAKRYAVLERFYERDAGLVMRFYAGRLSLLDRAALLSGRPPIAVLPALRAFFGGGSAHDAAVG